LSLPIPQIFSSRRVVAVLSARQKFVFFATGTPQISSTLGLGGLVFVKPHHRHANNLYTDSLRGFPNRVFWRRSCLFAQIAPTLQVIVLRAVAPARYFCVYVGVRGGLRLAIASSQNNGKINQKNRRPQRRVRSRASNLLSTSSFLRFQGSLILWEAPDVPNPPRARRADGVLDPSLHGEAHAELPSAVMHALHACLEQSSIRGLQNAGMPETSDFVTPPTRKRRFLGSRVPKPHGKK